MLGGAAGDLMRTLFPANLGATGAYAMVGMAAMVAAATRGPIMAILIVFEMTGEYRTILPLMLACVSAVLVSRALMADSIFTLRFSREGKRIEFGRESAILHSYHVEDVMETQPPLIPVRYTFDKILNLFLSNNESHYYVVDEAGTLAGRISIHDIKEVLHRRSLGQVLIAGDLCGPVTQVVHRKDDLEHCLLLLGEEDADDLPVLESPERPLLVGVVTRRAIFEIYNREVLHQEVLGIKISHEDSPREERVELPAAYQVRLLAPPPAWIGQSLRELRLRERFRVEVLAFKRSGRGGGPRSELPDPDRRLAPGDRLVVVGHTDALAALPRLIG
jgi:CIC family chloride channel protein